MTLDLCTQVLCPIEKGERQISVSETFPIILPSVRISVCALSFLAAIAIVYVLLLYYKFRECIKHHHMLSCIVSHVVSVTSGHQYVCKGVIQPNPTLAVVCNYILVTICIDKCVSTIWMLLQNKHAACPNMVLPEPRVTC